ncbi:ATP-binding protein [Streptomyces bauhiniae]|uniref:ATP-binding protein n=1 Tax=Streptomyces bauhiniae TaxID=2340725 RepID=UPI0037F89756
MTLQRAGAVAFASGALPTAPPFEVVLAAQHFCVRVARRVAIHYLTVHRLDTALFEPVELAVSELVTNAVEYGNGEVGLRLRCHDGELRIEVRDGNPAPAILRNPADDDESGRGLYIVAVLARDWGVSPEGRMTWCTFRATGGRGS